MNRLNVTEVRYAELFVSGLFVSGLFVSGLFASGLQQSDAASGDAVAEAVRQTVRQFGVQGCAGRMAQEFGDHPETAEGRMRWVRQLVDGLAADSIPHAA